MRGLSCLLACGALVLGAPAWALAPEPALNVAATGTVEVVFSPWNDGEAALLAAIDEAREQILVQAYLFTSKPLARALIAAHRRGVRVEVMLDAESNRPASASMLPDFMAAGVPVLVETRHNIAHNKVMLFDPGSSRAAVATGSYNYTRSARLANAENLLILRGNPALARAYLDNWLRHKAEAQLLQSLDNLPARRRKEDGREPDRATAD